MHSGAEEHLIDVTTTAPHRADCSRMDNLAPGPAEFAAVFEAQQGRLLSLAFVILRDPEEAREAVQETAEAAWVGWARRADPSRTAGWLRTICVRKALRRRSWGRRWASAVLTGAEVDAAHHHLEAEADLDVHRAFGKLSPKQRAVIALHFAYGYTVAESAALMGCSAGAAASHLSRALGRLRRDLSDAGRH
jgi:RNA polymerase sigma factor (sigma-70 family)